jgi:hypothetical protein
MLIFNLPYLEPLSESPVLSGGSSIEMEGKAFALGNNTYTFTGTDTKLRKNRRVTIAKGTATALAIGEFTYVDTSYELEGFDLYRARTRSFEGDKFSFERTRVIAIDLPR